MSSKTIVSTPQQDFALAEHSVTLAACSQPHGPQTTLHAVTIEDERVIVETFEPDGQHAWREASVPSEDWGDPADVSDPDTDQ